MGRFQRYYPLFQGVGVAGGGLNYNWAFLKFPAEIGEKKGKFSRGVVIFKVGNSALSNRFYRKKTLVITVFSWFFAPFTSHRLIPWFKGGISNFRCEPTELKSYQIGKMSALWGFGHLGYTNLSFNVVHAQVRKALSYWWLGEWTAREGVLKWFRHWKIPSLIQGNNTDY